MSGGESGSFGWRTKAQYHKRIRELHRQGLNDREGAQLLHVSTSSFQRERSKMGLKSNDNRGTHARKHVCAAHPLPEPPIAAIAVAVPEPPPPEPPKRQRKSITRLQPGEIRCGHDAGIDLVP